MYKMVAIDLDGTLLTDDLMISPATVTAIQKAVEAGTIVTIATGRMFSSAKRIALQLNLNVPLITYQGALIKDVNEKEVWYERTVPPGIAQKLIEISRKKKLHLQIYQNDILYSAVENDKLIAYAEAVKVPYQIEPDLIKLVQKDVTKLLFIEEPDVLDHLQNELQILFGESAHIAKSKKHYLEITHPEANKGSALLYLAKKLGIERTEIIGIGDNFNDIELIEAAGLGVAMGNAVMAVKDKADYTTFSNNEEGVLHVIEKFILEREGTFSVHKEKISERLPMA
ncbi:HAD family phosphatase [Planomicrobium chinense]|uniref:Cof-type HAD-IIB family hydrolase n=1 Tax=Planococcus chinensis TaxID=272917 RepID=UPI001CC4C731|nr:Cof-type HAD-IIB family hydrolase [Planococcus chinensis]MBZ5202219.1 HAD family phosphatase [Planococcus chinensis]